MNTTDLILQNMFDLLLMKEAHSLGMIDDETWKEFVVKIMKMGCGLSIEGMKGEHNGNEH